MIPAQNSSRKQRPGKRAQRIHQVLARAEAKKQGRTAPSGLRYMAHVEVTCSVAVTEDEWLEVLGSLPNGSVGSWPAGPARTARYGLSPDAATQARSVMKAVGTVSVGIDRVLALQGNAHVSHIEIVPI
jgi:hypothetical protein